MRFKYLSAFILACVAIPLMADEDYSNWRYSRGIVLNTTPTGANVANPVYNFPLLVRLTADQGDVFGNTKAGGADIRFTKADGVTRLPHQIERWDKANQVAEIWVQVDTVHGSGYTSLKMHWSNAAAADSSKGSQVFNFANGYAGVWHMGDAAGANDRPSATGSGNKAVPTGNSGRITIPTVAGMVGLADSLRGNGRGTGFIGDHFDLTDSFPTLGYYSSVALSMWVKPASFGNSNSVRLLDFGNQDRENSVWMGRHGSTGNKLNGGSILEASPPEETSAASNTLVPGVWQHITYTIAEGAAHIQTLYRNGVIVKTGDTGNVVEDVVRKLNYIGRSGVLTDSTFRGVVDEVRVSYKPHDSDWVKLSYETQKPAPVALKFWQALPDSMEVGHLTVGEIRLYNPLNSDSAFFRANRLEMNSGDTSYNLQVILDPSADGIVIQSHSEGEDGNESTRITSSALTTGAIGATHVNLSGPNALAEDEETILSGTVGLDYLTGLTYTRTEAHDSSEKTQEITLSPTGMKITVDGEEINESTLEIEPHQIKVTGWLGTPDEVYTLIRPNDISTTNLYAATVQATTITATEVVATPKWESWPDYVFSSDHKRRSLGDIEAFILKNKHLPDMPSAADVASEGVGLVEMNMKLLKTVEELTLHVIELDKQVRAARRGEP